MFAPGAARPLSVAAALIVAFSLAVAFRLLPVSPLNLGALAASIALWGFVATFFRDPERSPGTGIVSAADGRVRAVEAADGRVRVSVFMNVTNVHVNRLPLDARVDDVESAGAGYRPAFRSDAEHNVSRRYRLTTALGPVEVVQVTGILARRLVTFVRPGDHRKKADRFGMIVLGSRVDVLLPLDRVVVTVHVGDRVRAGSSTIAEVRP